MRAPASVQVLAVRAGALQVVFERDDGIGVGAPDVDAVDARARLDEKRRDLWSRGTSNGPATRK